MRAIAAAVVFLLLPAVAWAQAHPLLTSPPMGGVVASAQEVRITFSEAVRGGASGIRVLTARDQPLPTPFARVERANPRVLVLRLGRRLPPGGYEVQWWAVTANDVRTQGGYSFTIRP